jgi:hypothetical protein
MGCSAVGKINENYGNLTPTKFGVLLQSDSQVTPFPLTKSPSFVFEWLALLLPICEVPGSNIGPETVYPEVFRGFPQSL